MATWLAVMLFSVGAVLFFVVGMSLTLMIKGHHIDGEISTNRHMHERGITCAVKDAAASGVPAGSRAGTRANSTAEGCAADGVCSTRDCASCA